MSPPLHVLAGGFARLASHRAAADHIFWVLIALAGRTPALAVRFQILALWRAQTATRGTDAQHRIGIQLPTEASVKPERCYMTRG